MKYWSEILANVTFAHLSMLYPAAPFLFLILSSDLHERWIVSCTLKRVINIIKLTMK